MLVSYGNQKVEWKGRIEVEDGVKAVKNPDKPLFGELIFDLKEDLIIGNEEDKNYMFYQARDIKIDSQGNIYVLDAGNHRLQKFDTNGNYLQTIGRKGQGPGEFASIYNMLFDNKNNLYIRGRRIIHIFNDRGEFIRNVAFPISIHNFAVCTEGNFIVSGFVTSEKGQNYGVLVVDSTGKIIKNISEFPGIDIFQRGKSMFFLSHAYSPMLCFAPISNKGVIFGYSPEYKLCFINQKEDIFLIIKKDESPHPISRGEKDKIIDERHEDTGRNGRKWPKDIIEEAANFSKYRPFFNRILTDNKGRIYVKKVKSVLDKSKETEFDIFSNDGYYLYKTSFSFTPNNITNGYLYYIFTSEETGEVRIKRFKIKNWNQIKVGI
jgi:hypothetical protein